MPSGRQRISGKSIAVKKTSRNAKKSEALHAARGRWSRRNVVVMAGLLTALTLTSVALLLMAPAPLIPDVPSLFVTELSDSLDPLFQTRRPIQDGGWKYIYIHHSKSRRGNALGLSANAGMADHFLVGNGDGCGDGEIQIGPRWSNQQPAGAPAATLLDRSISICLVGDFDQSAPTALQMRNLQRLVRALQQECRISASGVRAFDDPATAVGIGRRFPAAGFNQHLLP